jgi:small subunit ribosomal protein S6
MKLYELTVIINPTLDDAAVQTEIDRIEKQITGGGGQIEKIDRWGIRRFTYRIAGHHQGQYVLFLFKSNPGLSTEIERSLRLSENILRFLTILSPGITSPAAKPIKVVDEDDSGFEDFSPRQE